ncbi:CDP-glycerol glycerophosphotransferase family protein [Pseudogracilibacillus sp. SE30717A]|uniref:CDP-glycerol glycerophosphotransferase family protein n=1 Tax=Pseudogracilibacillus sp. SE30717A TaxID=3098293 RepID=UPI00300E5712
MLGSPIDNEDAVIRTDSPVNFDLTHFSLKGSNLELEGYVSVTGIYSYSEDRIRKTLIFVPEIDIKSFREEYSKDEQYQDLTDKEIIDMHIVEIPLDNCTFEEVTNHENSKIEDKESLGGFKLSIDLAVMSNGKPLEKGKYNIYIKLEQLLNENDDVKYLKTVQLSTLKNFLNNGMITTHLHYYSSTLIMKYNLIALFDAKHKTLKLENTLLQSFNPQELSEEEGMKVEHRYVQAVKRRFFKLFYILFSILPINKRKVSFASDSRTELNGNLYFVYEELYKRNLDLKIKFIFNERIDNTKTFSNLLKTAFHFATSKIILLDDFYPLIYPLNIRRNSDLIQVWHAAGAFKTFGFSRIGRPGGPSPRSRNHRNYTKVTVSSEGVREHYAEGFGVKVDKVHPTGVPRSDIFFDEEYKAYVRKTLYDKYPFLKEKKVILFAPTFRGNGQSSAHFPFHVLDFKKLYEELKDDYVFLFKIHPFVNNKLSIPYEYIDFFYDFSDFREINDLLLVTDILITDYSSVCFEYALLDKPMLFFAFDVEDYIRTRDFYYNYFNFIPGPLVKTTEEIIKTIQSEQFELEKIKPFVRYFFNGTLGKASQNVVDEVIIPSLESEYEEEEVLDIKLEPPKSRIELFERSLHEEDEDNA